MNERKKKNDLIFLGVIFLVLVLGCIVYYSLGKKDGAEVKITTDGELYGVYSLEEEQTISIQINDKVTNVLVIKDGKADMTEADCPDRLCVHQKAISNVGETIVCLPNKVVAEVISAEEEKSLDSVAG